MIYIANFNVNGDVFLCVQVMLSYCSQFFLPSHMLSIILFVQGG